MKRLFGCAKTEVWESAFLRSPMEVASESAEAVALGLAPAEVPAKVPVAAEPRAAEAVPARWGRSSHLLVICYKVFASWC